MRHRMYDSRIGRFTQMDPVPGNRPHEHYRYAANNPVMMTDPNGTWPILNPGIMELYRRSHHSGWEYLEYERLGPSFTNDMMGNGYIPIPAPTSYDLYRLRQQAIINREREMDSRVTKTEPSQAILGGMTAGFMDVMDCVWPGLGEVFFMGGQRRSAPFSPQLWYSNEEVAALRRVYGTWVSKALGQLGVGLFEGALMFGPGSTAKSGVVRSTMMAERETELFVAIAERRAILRQAAEAVASNTRSMAARLIPTDLMSKTQFGKLLNSINAKGFLDPIIKYVDIDGQLYVVLGSNRLMAARRLGRTGELVLEEVQLPFRGYKTIDDVIEGAVTTEAELMERSFRR